MSREFGSCCKGYFHLQIDYAASDCKGGRDQLTRLWGEFLEEFTPIAFAIASSEACDSGPDYPILENLKRMAALQACLSEVSKYLLPYQQVAEEAVRQTVQGK